jgi:hypothetical protein
MTKYCAVSSRRYYVKVEIHYFYYASPSDYIRGLIREDLKRLEAERLEIELIKGLKSGKGIPMTKGVWKRMRAEALRDRTH